MAISRGIGSGEEGGEFHYIDRRLGNVKNNNPSSSPREAVAMLLESMGVETARRLAAKHHPSRIEAAIALYWERLDNGDELTPGWIVWRVNEPGAITPGRHHIAEVAIHIVRLGGK